MKVWGIGLVVLAVLGALGHLPVPSGTVAAESAAAPSAPETRAETLDENHSRVVATWGAAAAAEVELEPTTPVLPADSGSGKRVVFDITTQHVWLVASDGTVEREYPVSGSRYDQLDAGTYEVFSASRHAVSWQHTETMEYMVRFHRGRNANIGFHDIPVASSTGEAVQDVSELGTPLSDGCIRQDRDDAKALYEFAPGGTTVVVVRS